MTETPEHDPQGTDLAKQIARAARPGRVVLRQLVLPRRCVIRHDPRRGLDVVVVGRERVEHLLDRASPVRVRCSSISQCVAAA